METGNKRRVARGNQENERFYGRIQPIAMGAGPTQDTAGGYLGWPDGSLLNGELGLVPNSRSSLAQAFSSLGKETLESGEVSVGVHVHACTHIHVCTHGCIETTYIHEPKPELQQIRRDAGECGAQRVNLRIRGVKSQLSSSR